MTTCEVHGEEFKQFFSLGDVTFSPMKESDEITVDDNIGVTKMEFMCPECRRILYRELGYEKN